MPSAKQKDSKSVTRITAGFCKLSHDIIKRGKTDLSVIYLLRSIFFAQFIVSHKINYSTAKILCHSLYNMIAFRMNSACIKRMTPAPDTKKACCLFKSLGTEARNLLQITAGDKRTVFITLEDDGLGKDFVQPLSMNGGWISPQEYGYWCLHTTDVFPEQAVDQCNQAIGDNWQVCQESV